MLPLVVLLFLVRAGTTTAESPTFDYEDPVNGDTLNCTQCPPGMYMYEPCTSTAKTKCEPCPKNHYTEIWNYLPHCLYCSNFCTDTLIVKQECLATQDRVCQCKEGYYWQNYYCSKHTRCKPGFGAKIIGDEHRDTHCEICPRGTFSSHTSSSDQCLNHTDCEKLLVALPGRTWHDNICVSCTDLKNKGYMNIFRHIIPSYFNQKQFQLRKRKAAFLTNNQKSLQRFSRSHSTISRLQNIAKWTEKATDDQLKKLPKMLKRSGLTTAARQIQKIVNRLEKLKCDL